MEKIRREICVFNKQSRRSSREERKGNKGRKQISSIAVVMCHGTVQSDLLLSKCVEEN